MASGFFGFLIGNQIAHINFARRPAGLAGIPTAAQFLDVAGAERGDGDTFDVHHGVAP